MRLLFVSTLLSTALIAGDRVMEVYHFVGSGDNPICLTQEGSVVEVKVSGGKKILPGDHLDMTHTYKHTKRPFESGQLIKEGGESAYCLKYPLGEVERGVTTIKGVEIALVESHQTDLPPKVEKQKVFKVALDSDALFLIPHLENMEKNLSVDDSVSIVHHGARAYLLNHTQKVLVKGHIATEEQQQQLAQDSEHSSSSKNASESEVRSSAGT